MSAISPSILVAQIEVEKRQREQDKPPILPSPVAEKGPGDAPAGDEAVLRAMADELKRTMGLQVEDLEKPYFVQFDVDDTTSCQLAAAYGVITAANRNRARSFRGRSRVGSMELDNTNFSGGNRPASFPPPLPPSSEDFEESAHGGWPTAQYDEHAPVALGDDLPGFTPGP